MYQMIIDNLALIHFIIVILAYTVSYFITINNYFLRDLPKNKKIGMWGIAIIIFPGLIFTLVSLILGWITAYLPISVQIGERNLATGIFLTLCMFSSMFIAISIFRGFVKRKSALAHFIYLTYFFLFVILDTCGLESIISTIVSIMMIAHNHLAFLKYNREFLNNTPDIKLRRVNRFHVVTIATISLLCTMWNLFPEDIAPNMSVTPLTFVYAMIGVSLYISLYITCHTALDNLHKESLLEKEIKRSIALKDISEKDELTGLLNRRGFLNEVYNAMNSEENKGKIVVVVYVDLDGLKYINDVYGHESGNEAIIIAAEILKASFTSDVIVSRIGGDEFTVFSVTHPVYENAQLLGELIISRVETVTKDYNVRYKKLFNVNLSIGVHSFLCNPETDIIKELEIADKKLYSMKQYKRDIVARQTAEMA